MSWSIEKAIQSYVKLIVVFLLFSFSQTTLVVKRDYDCSSSSRCIFSYLCEFKGVKNLKWCDEKKSKVCCPISVLYEKTSKEVNFGESSYSSHSNDYSGNNYDPTYVPAQEGYRKDYKDEYDVVRDGYRDFYEEDYFGSSLSIEAKRILKTYEEKECGVRRAFYGKISTGHEADFGVTKFGEFPWQAAILLKIEEKFGLKAAFKYICGGTVINPKLILTAAHCVKGIRFQNLKIKLGEWNLKGSQGEMFPSLERKIERVIIHNNYNSATFSHDIAILVLNKPVNLRKTPHVSQVCLPPKRTKFDEYSKCFIVGWGNDIYKPNYGSNILKVASVSLLKTDCRHKLKKSIPSLSNNFLKEDITCVSGGFGKDACLGDGGGAVICPLKNQEVPVCREGYTCEDEHYFLAGVISWGSDKCGQDGSVTVITDITSHYDWISDKTRRYGGVSRLVPNKDDFEYGSKFDYYGYEDDSNNHYGKYQDPYNFNEQRYEYGYEDEQDYGRRHH